MSSNTDLYTRCTRCETIFKVTTGDLQASSGQVRCGRCQAVFDAFASLTARPPAQTKIEAAAKSGGETRPGGTQPVPHEPETPELTLLDTTQSERVPQESVQKEPMPRGSVATGPVAKEPAPKEAAPDETIAQQSERQESARTNHVQPEFVSSEAALGAAIQSSPSEAVKPFVPVVEPPRAAARLADDSATNLYEWEFKPAPKYLQSRLWLGLLLLLGVVAVAQAATIFRTHLMVNFPQVRPLYEGACQWLSCEIGLPRLADRLDIDASDLQVINPKKPNQVELTALIRNRARVAVEFPAFELTLSNEKEQVVARRVFLPDEYLSDTERVEQGFTEQGELAVRLFLDVGALRAAGYRIYLFYPS